MVPQLPDSIGNLAELQELCCSNNQLQCFRDNLREKFGEAWFEQTLETQVRPTLQPTILPGYAAPQARLNQPGNAEETVISKLRNFKLN